MPDQLSQNPCRRSWTRVFQKVLQEQVTALGAAEELHRVTHRNHQI